MGGPDNRGTEGAEIETSKASRGKGTPLSRLWVLREREHRKLPQRRPGWSIGQKRILEYLELEKTTSDSHKSVIFDISAAHI